jgi:hypothetical protein
MPEYTVVKTSNPTIENNLTFFFTLFAMKEVGL